MRHEVCSAGDLSALGPWAGQNEPGSEAKIRSIDEIPSIRHFAGQKIEFVVENLIAAGTVTAFTGESGAGKTTVVNAICGAVKDGLPFAGLITQRRPILVLDRENPLSVVIERFDRLSIQDGREFKVWGTWVSEDPPIPFSSIVVDWVNRQDPKPLVVVDSLVSFHAGSENDATETRAYMQGFRRLAALGATVIVLHHSGKADSAKEYRGSSDIKASIDVGYRLTNIGSPSRLEVLQLKTFKARFQVAPELILRVIDGRFTIDQGQTRKTTTDLLKALLLEHPNIRGTEFERLATERDIGRNNARSFLSSGVENKTVKFKRGEKNSRQYTWVGNHSDATDEVTSGDAL